MNTVLKGNDILKIHYTEEGSSENIVPSDIPLDIVYEDEDIILINKQAKTPVHPSIRHYENTIANGLWSYFIKKNESFNYRFIKSLDLYNKWKI